METREVAIVEYARTPFGKANKGKLKDTRPDDMAAHAIEAVLDQTSGVEPGDVEDVVLGCAFPEAEQGMNVARIASQLAGLPDDVPAMTMNRFCSSGVQTISTASKRIATGEIDVAIAGGTESMSMVPMSGNTPSQNPKLMEEKPEVYISMGNTAENVAERFDISRERQDEFAYRSHMNAVEARERGFFEGEIVPLETSVVDENGERQSVTVDHDENVRPDTNLDTLSSLPPSFADDGTVTPGNASPLTDGAGAVVLMAADKADELGLEPMGYFRELQVAGVPPEIMGIGPDSTGKSIEDIDLVELNEAFASQSVYCAEELGIELDKLNVNGAAIAIGHPLGVSGTRMAGTILRALEEEGGRFGIVTMCVGGGMGAAALVERA
ncbi:MAG: acetyl-CoA C-acyltransferase [Bradymonadaceae bacterium]